MEIHKINTSNWIPKEALTAALGITIAATSNVAIQFLSSTRNLPNIVENFAGYSCGAAAVAGTVMAVYSAVRLGQKILSEKTELHKAVTVTALGGLSTALIQTIGEHFWEIAPSFYYLGEHSLAYCIGTNLAWQICAITGIAGIVFLAYTAYRTGQTALATINPVNTPST